MSEQNPFPGENNTGHIWDEDLRELTNQPPKWWMLGLHASWIFVLVYTILYPAWPLIHGHTKGVLGWTSIQEYKADLAQLDKKRAKYEDQIKGMSAAQILANDELNQYVVRSAKVLFGDNCAACHGSGGQGNPGFPVLADDDWLLGGKIDQIQHTITMGHMGMMPAMGGQQLTDAQIDELANAIIAQKPTSTPLFTQMGCVGCHGMDGKGNQLIGSANLTDGIYRFVAKDQLASVKHTIKYGVNVPGNSESRQAKMPTFGNGNSKLSSEDIKKLAVYVWNLGGGQK